MTTMICLPERWQVAATLSGKKVFFGDARQRTDESVAVQINERNNILGESDKRLSMVAHNSTTLVALDTRWKNKHRLVGAVRQAAESLVVLASRFKSADREQSNLICARRMRSQRSDVVEDIVRSASGSETGELAAGGITNSMAIETTVLRVAHSTLAVVELRTSRGGVDGSEH